MTESELLAADFKKFLLWILW